MERSSKLVSVIKMLMYNHQTINWQLGPMALSPLLVLVGKQISTIIKVLKRLGMPRYIKTILEEVINLKLKQEG